MTYRHYVTTYLGRYLGRRIGTILAACLLPAGLAITPLPAAQAAQVDPSLATFYAQEADWGACADRRTGPGVQCATVEVPLDYTDPTGRTISVALLRVPATGSATGSLVVNPGGPGASGMDFAEYLATVVDSDVRREFHIVGFDPRGVGQSAPVQCMTGKQTTRWYRTDPTPDTAEERRTLWRRASLISDGCLKADPQLVRFVGTSHTVRDMDVIRSAVGDSTLNWFGFSYGTSLGALYAQEFPDKVGRMVLDGGVDPGLDAMQVSKDQSDGFQRAIQRFATDCAKRTGCVANSRSGVVKKINEILRDLEKGSLPTDGSRRLVQGEAITALFYSMYSTSLWPSLRTGLTDADEGDGTMLQILAQVANDQTGPDSYRTNIASAFYAIGCWDYPATPGIVGLRKSARDWSRSAPVPEMARAMSWGNAPCSTWFAHSPQAPAAVASTTATPILIIGTTFDPATPYAWSQSLAAQLPTSRLLTHRGDGHTAYGGNTMCIDGITDRYLLTGALPEPGTTCTS